MSDTSLQACPFCGSYRLKVECKTTLQGYNGFSERIERHTYSVRCNVCHARGGAVGGAVNVSKYIKDIRSTEIYADDKELKAKAVELWNTRY